MNFKTVKEQAIIVDPRHPTQPKSIPVEVREDPLTGRTSRICHFGLLKWEKPDLEKLVAGTEAACPFCPDKVLVGHPSVPERDHAGRALCAGRHGSFPQPRPL